jgi:hypothetical protein
MNASTPPRSRHRTAIALAALLTAAALLLAGCGGSHSSTDGLPSAAGSSFASTVAYASCMRNHGVPNYPDPDSSGQLPKTDAQHLGVSTSQYRDAQRACEGLLPTGGSLQQRESQCTQNNDCPPALVQQMMSADEKLARCMRSHGWPKFPDPTNGGAGGPWFNISQVGISDAESHTHRFEAALDECTRLIGVNAPESFG